MSFPPSGCVAAGLPQPFGRLAVRDGGLTFGGFSGKVPTTGRVSLPQDPLATGMEVQGSGRDARCDRARSLPAVHGRWQSSAPC